MIQKLRNSVPNIHEDVFVASTAVVAGKVTIGQGSSIWYGAVLRGDLADIEIGENTNIQDNCVVHLDEGCPCRIGSGVTIGHGAILHGCTIGDNCLIGMGAIVLNGAVVEPGAMVGAGALVTQNTVIPAGSLAIGSPAKVKRQLTPQEMASIEDSAQEYREMAQWYKREE